MVWYDLDFPYRKTFTVNGEYVSGSLTNFPILWKTSADASLLAHARSDGLDIIFVISSTNLRTHHEIENYGKGSGVIWVRIPTLDEKINVDVCMYYGDNTNHAYDTDYKPSGTWDINYIAVWHLNSPTDTQYSGSTVGNYKSDTITLTSRTAGNGIISWNSPNWGAEDQYIRVPHNTALSLNGSDMTIEAWINSNNWATEQCVIVKALGAGTGWQHELYPANNQHLQAGEASAAITCTNSNPFPVNDTWYNEAVIWNTTTNVASFYSNGKVQTVGSDNDMADWAANTNNLYMGNISTYAYDFNGEMDEMRISNVVRPAAWLKTSYSSMSSPATFLTFGTEESAPSVGELWSTYKTFVIKTKNPLTFIRNSGIYTVDSSMKASSSNPSTWVVGTIDNLDTVFYPYNTVPSGTWKWLVGNSTLT